MILKGSQRGGAKQLATHLLKTEENEHVAIHELDGFVAEDLHGALQEIYAVSRGTRCRQFMFSVSLNPPEKESVPVEYFEKAIKDIENGLGLEGQARAVVFHEKEGRRHYHAVWSRIDTEKMKPINLPYYKLKLRDISRQLYFQYGWDMPQGIIEKQERNPFNYSLAEWQQAKRVGEDPKILKNLFQECWASSDSKQGFKQALSQYGLYLAKGDRRGFVAIDHRGEVFSLSRWMEVKNKELKMRLGSPESLPNTQEVKRDIAKRMTKRLRVYIREVQTKLKQQIQPFLQKKQALVNQHQDDRQGLKEKQEERWQRETLERSQRLPKGLKGLWSRITGKYQTLRKQNEIEMERCRIRDRDEKQHLIERQLRERQRLQEHVKPLLQEHKQEIVTLKQDVARYMELGGSREKDLQEEFGQVQKDRDMDPSPEM